MAYDLNTIIECKLQYTANAQKCFNVLHYLPDVIGTGFTITAMLNGLLNKLTNNIGFGWTFEVKGLMSADVSIDLVTAQVVYPTRYILQSKLVGINGTDVLTCKAQNVAATFKKQGVLANKHNIGSYHTGGLASGAYNAGELTAGFLTLMDNFITRFLGATMVDGVSPVNYFPAILNKTKVPGTSPPKYAISGASPVVAWTPQTTLRTQRTRNIGKGI